ncbi:MAG TPA: NAD(P)-dependent oxidoreductase, partial [bacterium]|nr:NAD(P)-dependent oxidoreductase [bacterium]
GNRGNLGSQWEKLLISDLGVELTGWDRDSLDMLDFPQLLIKLNDLHPEVVINTVAYNTVDKCEEDDYALAQRLNGELVGVLAEWALKNQAVFFHYSTDYVFSGENKEGYGEETTPDPINNYGRSKLLGEKELLAREALGLKYYLIRTSKLFGPQGKSEMAKPSFFAIMRRLADEQPELKVVDGELSCFTYTPDLAVASWRLFTGQLPFGIYHLVNSGPATWLQGAKTLFKLLNREVPITPVRPEDLKRLAARPKASVLLNTKVAQLRHYSEALKEYLLLNR